MHRELSALCLFFNHFLVEILSSLRECRFPVFRILTALRKQVAFKMGY